MNYILTGSDKELAKVIQENRNRVNRGLVQFTPMTEMVKSDNSEVIANLTAENETLKAEIIKLQEELNANQSDDTKEVAPADDKNVDIDDLHEVDLDDTKEVATEDTKEVSADDTKTTKSKSTKK